MAAHELPSVRNSINALAGFKFPYPVMAWESLVGFVTEDGRALAVDDFYQSYVKAQNPFVLMDWARLRREAPGLERGYVERDFMPGDYWHLIWNRPLEYHLPKYRAYGR